MDDWRTIPEFPDFEASEQGYVRQKSTGRVCKNLADGRVWLLDDLPRKRQRDTLFVLEHIVKAGRFSVFEATANQTIAGTMDRIVKNGWIERDISCGFPWTKVKLTAADAAALGMEHG